VTSCIAAASLPLLLLWRLLIGMAMGRPFPATDCIVTPDEPFEVFEACVTGPSDMYCESWNSQTTYGSMLGLKPRPSLIITVRVPRTGPIVVPSVLILLLFDNLAGVFAPLSVRSS
jgi:hypothetical protein